MNRLIITGICILLFDTWVYGQIQLQTIAEKSEFKSTSNYHDVISYIELLKKKAFNTFPVYKVMEKTALITKPIL